MFTLGWRWMEFRAARIGAEDGGETPTKVTTDSLSAGLAALPLVMVNALFTWVIIPRLDTAVIQCGRSGGGLDALP